MKTVENTIYLETLIKTITNINVNRIIPTHHFQNFLLFNSATQM